MGDGSGKTPTHAAIQTTSALIPSLSAWRNTNNWSTATGRGRTFKGDARTSLESLLSSLSRASSSLSDPVLHRQAACQCQRRCRHQRLHRLRLLEHQCRHWRRHLQSQPIQLLHQAQAVVRSAPTSLLGNVGALSLQVPIAVQPATTARRSTIMSPCVTPVKPSQIRLAAPACSAVA